jgi:glycosyltransferase involved in cell wall biosynthesis
VTARPLVSIVTPTLNQGGFIEATIRSIRGQTYDHYEHIVVDGGSTDGTLDILARLDGTYPMRWLSEPDRGMYDAVNKGMRLAMGDILCYLNSDDLFFPWTLETVVEAFAAHPEADFIHGDVLNVDDDTARQILYLEPPFDRGHVQSSGGLAQPAVFWRRSAFERVNGLDASLRFVGDLDYWLRAAEGSSFRKVNEFLAIERNHRGTLREGSEAPMMAEISMVRRRHAPLTTGQRRWNSVKGALWRRAWFRWYWLEFLVQASLPSALRVPYWRRLLAAGHTRISKRRVLVMLLVPIGGRRLRSDLVAPDRFWLEPPMT